MAVPFLLKDTDIDIVLKSPPLEGLHVLNIDMLDDHGPQRIQREMFKVTLTKYRSWQLPGMPGHCLAIEHDNYGHVQWDRV